MTDLERHYESLKNEQIFNAQMVHTCLNKCDKTAVLKTLS